MPNQPPVPRLQTMDPYHHLPYTTAQCLISTRTTLLFNAFHTRKLDVIAVLQTELYKYRYIQETSHELQGKSQNFLLWSSYRVMALMPFFFF